MMIDQCGNLLWLRLPHPADRSPPNLSPRGKTNAIQSQRLNRRTEPLCHGPHLMRPVTAHTLPNLQQSYATKLNLSAQPPSPNETTENFRMS